MTHDSTLAVKLARWSELNALVMGAVVAAVLAGQWFIAMALVAGSFLILVLHCRGQWTPPGPFGVANTLTLLRLLASLALLLPAARTGVWPVIVVVLVLCADGLDGWVARCQGIASPFGHHFDQEVDAFSFLALCLLLYVRGALGLWVVLPGLLRYLFVGFVKMAGPPRRSVQGNRFTKSISVIVILVFALCLLPVGTFCTVPAAVASLGLAISFLHSGWQLVRPDSGA